MWTLRGILAQHVVLNLSMQAPVPRVTVIQWGLMGMLGLSRDNGKEHGNYDLGLVKGLTARTIRSL